MHTIKLFLPLFPNKDIINFKGYVQVFEDSCCICIFITDFNPKEMQFTQNDEENILYGIFKRPGRKYVKQNQSFSNYLVLQESASLCTVPEIVSLQLNDSEIDYTDNYIVLFYDHEQIRRSETLGNGNFEYTTLQKLVQGKVYLSETNSIETLTDRNWLAASMLCEHFYNYINLMKWFIQTVKKDKKVSIKHGNLLLAILTDIVLGYIIIEFLTPDKDFLRIMLMEYLEKLVNLMYSLLRWLMGAPAGFKLNNAFNKLLGKYFSYHVQLWWLFIDISGEKLDVILDIYHYISYLGITFQAALISDLICVVTFHSYCFYVYAARLFNLQVSGLIALLRLFVGRKYNPLRNSIDSCEYTNQELFVGTVAFTILLLLLPTTTMYYIVFTMFRLLSLLVQNILAKSIYWIQTLPLYVIFLKLIQSPKVAGKILIQVLDSDTTCSSVLRIRLTSKSFEDLISNFKPPVNLPNKVEWTGFLNKILTGKPIT